jgi:hypothetical protein
MFNLQNAASCPNLIQLSRYALAARAHSPPNECIMRSRNDFLHHYFQPIGQDFRDNFINSTHKTRAMFINVLFFLFWEGGLGQVFCLKKWTKILNSKYPWS